jgi:serine/threonine protein kinase
VDRPWPERRLGVDGSGTFPVKAPLWAGWQIADLFIDGAFLELDGEPIARANCSEMPLDFCHTCFIDLTPGEICSRCGQDRSSTEDPGDVLRPGSVIGGKYKVGRLLGRGGFGATYLAWDLNLRRRVAIKEFLPRQLASRMPGGTQVRAYTGNQEAFNIGLEKFLEEARHLAQFGDHPGIIRVLDFFEENGTGYMVMEYLDGGTLDQHVTATGPLDIGIILELLIPVADALRACHAVGLIHRDISPDNIFLTSDGRVKLLDFGAARAAIGSQSTNLSVILKEGYAPFEQYQRNGRQGPWTDIYALTATLYRLLTGDLPVTAPDRVAGTPLPRVSERGIKLPTGLQALLDKGLAIRPQERYQTVDAFLSDLKVIIASVPERAGNGQQRQSDRQKKLIVSLVAIALIVVVAVPMYFWVNMQPATGILALRVSPAVAVLNIDGKPAGQALGFRKELSAGPHALELSAPGYESRRELVTVPAGGEKNIEFALVKPPPPPPPTTGILSLRVSPSVAVVNLDGSPAGSAANFRQEVSTGPHELEISAPGYQSRHEAVTVPAGGEKNMEFALAKPPPPPLPTTGILSLRVSPSVAVLNLDGKSAGSAADFRQELSAGPHELELSAPGYQSRRETVTVPAGGEKNMELALVKPKPDLAGTVQSISGASRFKVGGQLIELWGIDDVTTKGEHIPAVFSYLKPYGGVIQCYRKAGDRYQCYAGEQDLAVLALQNRLVRLTPDAPSEYRALNRN